MREHLNLRRFHLSCLLILLYASIGFGQVITADLNAEGRIVALLKISRIGSSAEQASAIYVGKDQSNAYFITAFHAVKLKPSSSDPNAVVKSVELRLSNSPTWLPAQVLSNVDQDLDLAIAMIPISNIPANMPTAAISDPSPGTNIRIIGHPPAGLWSVWTGQIQNGNGPEGDYQHFTTTTDGSLAPGYSGGPVFDTRGSLIGMHIESVGTSYARAVKMSIVVSALASRNVPTGNLKPFSAVNEKDTTLPSGQALLLDGNTHYDDSGYSFKTRTKVSWGSGQADILFAGSRLFTQNNAGDAPGVMENAPADIDAHAGLQRSPTQSFAGICPLDGYVAHWFPHDPSDHSLTLNSYYCLRLRDGTHYAKIKISDIEPDRIAFDWIFQPSGSRNFNVQ